jgi:hypothetical protein
MKNFDIKWIAFALFVFGGTVVSLKLSFMRFAFPCFVVGHAIFVYDFWKSHKNMPLLLQNAYFLVVNLIATYIWFKG